MMKYKGIDQWEWDPMFENFNLTKEELELPVCTSIAIVHDWISSEGTPSLINIKRFINDNGWDM